MRFLSVGLLAFAAFQAASAQEISAALGRLHAIGEWESTYSWQLGYLHHFNPTWSASLGWLNEGHLPDHHRDGALVQAWRFHRMEKNDLRLGAGLGVYRYFDTTREGDAEDFRNEHGVLPMLSFRAQYPMRGGGWEAFVQLNRTLTGSATQTQAILVGASTHFGSRPSSGSAYAAGRDVGGHAMFESSHELTLYFGRTILNSFESETSDAFGAFSVEYRQGVTRYIDVSLAYCDEGNIDSVKRDGVTPQLWLATRSTQGWLVGFGVGPYFSRVFPEHDSKAPHSTVNVRTSLRYSILLGRHLWGHWGGRLQWNRTLTSYHRDSDLLQMGIAYQW
jgi:hypothetical protein